MPCDTIQQSTCNIGQIADKALIVKALSALGFTTAIEANGIRFGHARNGGFVFNDGRVELNGAAVSLDANTIKRAISTEAVKIASAKFGWTLKPAGQNKFTAQRRF